MVERDWGGDGFGERDREGMGGFKVSGPLWFGSTVGLPPPPIGALSRTVAQLRVCLTFEL